MRDTKEQIAEIESQIADLERELAPLMARLQRRRHSYDC
jgi:hypothetical protein